MSVDQQRSAEPASLSLAMPSGAVGAAVARCGQCGYVLEGLLGIDGMDLADSGSGIGGGGPPTLCPECAQPYNPFAPYRSLSRGQWATFLLIACTPQAALLALAWAMSFIPGDGVRAALGVVAPMWIGLLLYAVFVWPGLWSALMGKERVPRERSQLIVRAYLCAIAPLAVLVFLLIT